MPDSKRQTPTPSSPRQIAADSALADHLEQTIRERAYELWEAEGRPGGHALDHWLQAEHDVLTESFSGEEDPLSGVDQELPAPRAPGRQQ